MSPSKQNNQIIFYGYSYVFKLIHYEKLPWIIDHHPKIQLLFNNSTIIFLFAVSERGMEKLICKIDLITLKAMRQEHNIQIQILINILNLQLML